MKTVGFHTLGCKLNFSETSTIARDFIKSGYRRVDFSDAADVYVINTCSVTENADKECRKIVKKALSQKSDAHVVVVGCYAQLKPHDIAAIEGVSLVLGASEKFNIISYLNDFELSNSKSQVHSCEIDDVNTFVSSYSQGDRTRAFLKVQDGCDYTCSYCTIPLARGKSRSDSISNVLKNAQELANAGIKEIVLTGVNIGDFGKGNQTESKRKEEDFFELIKELDKIEGIERFRISSIEPNLLTNEIIDFVASSSRFVPHFHIPLQSGSDTILKAMRRRYLSPLYIERVKAIKEKMPHCCIGVDVIVGFPGESEAEFQETYNFLNELDISYLHVFTYSERDNTDATALPGVVNTSERNARNKMLRILSEKKKRAFYETQSGTAQVALMEEEEREGLMYGFTSNYVKVEMPYNKELVNTLIPIKLSSISNSGNFTTELSEVFVSHPA